jgi:hypothetical protein
MPHSAMVVERKERNVQMENEPEAKITWLLQRLNARESEGTSYNPKNVKA